MKTYEIPGMKCLKCGYTMNRTSSAPGIDLPPMEGDVAMCIMCRNLMVFNEDLTMRQPTPEERVRFSVDPDITEAQIAAAYVTGK